MSEKRIEKEKDWERKRKGLMEKRLVTVKNWEWRGLRDGRIGRKEDWERRKL